MTKSESLLHTLDMLIIILAIVVALVAWSLHLMQQAVDRNEFSLMLAGTLVAFSAAAMVAVYFLTGNYIGYLTGMTHTSLPRVSSLEMTAWVMEADSHEGTTDFSALQLGATSTYRSEIPNAL